MDSYSLDHLSPVDFEEFCYDLLKLEGFRNLSWRVGTARGGSPSDQGRDIQGEKHFVTFGDRTIVETWFFECKHYRRGVPPESIRGALAWAEAERPSYLALISSGAFSNGTKNLLDSYRTNNRPKFRIEIYERKDLEEMLAHHSSLLEKYSITPSNVAMELGSNLESWDDSGLANVMRAMMRTAQSSRGMISISRSSMDSSVRIAISSEHAEDLRRIIAVESNRQDLKAGSGPQSLALSLQIGSQAIPNIAIEATGSLVAYGLKPVIRGITPLDRSALDEKLRSKS